MSEHRHVVRAAAAAVLLAVVSLAAVPCAAADGTATPVAAALPVASAQATRPALIPAADFAANAPLSDPELSPAGQQLLARTVVDGRERVLVHNLGSGAAKLLPSPETAEVLWYQWAGEYRVLLSLGWSSRWDDEDLLASRLFVIDLRTREAHLLADKQTGPEGDDLLYVDPAGDWALLAQQKTIYEFPTVFRYDLATGNRTVVVRPVDDVWDWYADSAGVVRAGVGYLAQSWFLLYRRTGSESFERRGKVGYDDQDAAIEFARLAAESDKGFVLSNERTGRYALYEYDYPSRTLGAAVFESPTNDVEDFDVSEDGRRVLAVWYTDDRARVRWFDPDLARLQAELEARFPGRDVYLQSADDRRTRVVAWVGRATEPGAYYLYDGAAKKTHLLAQLNDRLDGRQLAATTYERYKARDGLEIPAYLTLPVGREARGLPLVVLPHGGPYGVRDALGYDPEVQFLANRGYAVLQPNYRGSSGYGAEYERKGKGQWGRAMQDDLDDGVDWLARSGIVDPARVCVVGSSYGGYAALWAVTRNPERYRCAASFAGVTDVKQQLRYVSGQLSSRDRLDWRETVVGESAFDLETVAPLQQVSRLTRPVLVAHGEDDSRVPFKQSSRYRDALARAQKPHEFVAYPDEGHGLDDPVHFTDWLERLGAFLETHNPAGPVAATPRSQ